MDRPLLVLDTECTSLQGAPHLVEVAAVRLVEGEIEDHFQTLVRPEVEVSEEAQALHGLDESDLRDAPDPGQALGELLDWMGADWLVAHHARADASALAYGLARVGLERPANPFLDTLGLARKTFPTAPDHKLATLTEWLELEVEGHHRALPDAVACSQVLDRCVQELGGWNAISEGDLFAKAHSPVTLVSAGPTEPRGNVRVRALRESIAADETVHILYGDGQSPPARIEVAPRFLYRRDKKDYMEALCTASGLWKTYRLDRLKKVLRIEEKSA